MSILSHRDEFLDLYKYSKNKEFEPSNHTKETDILGFTYTNKPNKEAENEQERNDNATDRSSPSR